MAESRDNGGKPQARATESLGWMVGSTVVPKKARLIEGVSFGAVHLVPLWYKWFSWAWTIVKAVFLGRTVHVVSVR